MPLFVLVHSPTVGPSTWSPVAGQLVASGCDAAVPSLLPVGEGGPPFWPRVVAAVTAGLAGTDPGQPVVLVAHSNAGVFIPVIGRGLARPVACSIFADATVPAASGHTPIADDQFLPFLRGLAGDDTLNGGGGSDWVSYQNDIGDVTVNLIDTPGHPDFIAEVERVLGVLDGAVLVVSAVEGVQAQTLVLMRALQRLGIATVVFVNKVDRKGRVSVPAQFRAALAGESFQGIIAYPSMPRFRLKRSHPRRSSTGSGYCKARPAPSGCDRRLAQRLATPFASAEATCSPSRH